MISLEATLDSLLNFFGKFFRTLWDSLVFPFRFLNNLSVNEKKYLSYKVYLFLGVFISYLFYVTDKSVWVFAPQLDDYKKTFADFSRLSVAEMILRAAPLCGLVYLVVLILTRLSFIKKAWRSLVVKSIITWYSSVLLLRCTVFIFIMLIEALFNDTTGPWRNKESLIRIIGPYLEPALVIYFAVGAIAPFRGIIQRFYGYNKELLIKFLSTLIATGIVFMLLFQPFYIIDKASEWFNLEPKKDISLERLRLYNYLPQDSAITISSQVKKDSVTLRCSVLVVNNENKTYYASRQAEWQMAIQMKHADTSCGITNELPLNFKVEQWYDNEMKPVLFIEPGDKKIFSLAAKTSVTNLQLFRNNMTDTCQEVVIKTPLLQFYKDTGISPEPGTITWEQPVQVIFK